jgi:hypothetical protein
MVRNVSSSVIARITNDQRRRLERIDAEDFSLVMNKAMEDLAATGIHVSKAYAQRGIYALKQYYAVAMLDPANAHSVTLPVDPFWHAHILFTAEYRHFCDEVIGEYMDHVPLDKRDRAKIENVRQLYDYTLAVLPKLFSDIDQEFWPAAVTDAELICYHKGNTEIYLDLQADRLFEPAPQGRAWAYAS